MSIIVRTQIALIYTNAPRTIDNQNRKNPFIDTLLSMKEKHRKPLLRRHFYGGSLSRKSYKNLFRKSYSDMKTVRFSEHGSSLPYSTASLMQAWRCLADSDILRLGEDGNEPLSCRRLRTDCLLQVGVQSGCRLSSHRAPMDGRHAAGQSQACVSSVMQQADGTKFGKRQTSCSVKDF